MSYTHLKCTHAHMHAHTHNATHTHTHTHTHKHVFAAMQRDFHAKERELATERKRMTISYRKDLDSIIEDRREEGERDMADDRAEDEDRKMFNDAKRVGATS